MVSRSGSQETSASAHIHPLTAPIPIAYNPSMPQSTLYAILPHPGRPVVFLTPTAGGWSLPHLTLDETIWIRLNARLNDIWQEHLELPVTALYVAGYEEVEDNRHEIVHLLENHSNLAEPGLPGRWIGRAALSTLPLARAQHRPLIERHLAEVESGLVPGHRQPWARPGWFRQATTWIKRELQELGYTVTGPPQHTHYWSLACVMRTPTDRGDIYFKAAADLPLFVNEPAVLTGLSHFFPDVVPAPLAVDRLRRWMLLPDFGPPLDEAPSLEAHIKMLHCHGKIQRQAVGMTGKLLALGCIDRRLPVLASQVDGLAHDVRALEGLSDEEIENLRRETPRLKAMCAELDAFGIPNTLMHGDLHLGNVAHRDGRLLFFDWTDAAVGHPFLDMVSIFDEKDETLRAQLRDEYLVQWQEYSSLENLQHAWRLAERLSALYQAVTFQYILGNLDEVTRKGFRNVIPSYVRWALAAELNSAAN